MPRKPSRRQPIRVPQKPAQEPRQGVTPAQAISPGGFLHYAFQGASWRRWIAVLRAAWGEALSPEELVLFKEVAGDRDPPSRPVKEFWAIAGRGAGKDSVASAVACCLALRDYSAFLRPGERATILCLACDRDQANIIRRYISGYFQRDPVLRAMVVRESDDALELKNDVEIVVATNSFRAVRGRRIVAAILDEAAFFRDERSAAPDVETYAAIVPSLERTPGAILVGISTAFRRSGLLYQQWSRWFGKASDDVLVVLGTTRQFNHTYSQERIDELLAQDAERYGAEFLSQWREDASNPFDEGLVWSCVDRGVTVRPPRPEITYRAAIDPSAGKGDSFTCAIGHAENGQLVLDCLREWRSPFVPTDVAREVGDLARQYRITTVHTDRHAEGWVTAVLAQVGLRREIAEENTSQIYLEALPHFTSGVVRLLDSRRLVHQFTGLERRSNASGRDTIRHPVGAHDDLAACVANLLVMLVADGPRLVRSSMLLRDGRPVEAPRMCEFGSAVVWVGGDGQTAVTYWVGVARTDELVLVDFDYAPLAEMPLERVYRRLWDVHHLLSGGV